MDNHLYLFYNLFHLHYIQNDKQQLIPVCLNFSPIPISTVVSTSNSCVGFNFVINVLGNLKKSSFLIGLSLCNT